MLTGFDSFGLPKDTWCRRLACSVLNRQRRRAACTTLTTEYRKWLLSTKASGRPHSQTIVSGVESAACAIHDNSRWFVVIYLSRYRQEVNAVAPFFGFAGTPDEEQVIQQLSKRTPTSHEQHAPSLHAGRLMCCNVKCSNETNMRSDFSQNASRSASGDANGGMAACPTRCTSMAGSTRRNAATTDNCKLSSIKKRTWLMRAFQIAGLGSSVRVRLNSLVAAAEAIHRLGLSSG